MRRMDSFGLVAFAIGALALLQVAAVNLRGTERQASRPPPRRGSTRR